uniref:Uncharacterized protein n=1 Tax=Lepeophtheirus salmonis TaxID=72036 RepID=A0A0K2U9Q9_LEPSM
MRNTLIIAKQEADIFKKLYIYIFSRNFSILIPNTKYYNVLYVYVCFLY